MATVLLAGTAVLSGTIISNADGDNVLSSSPTTSGSPLTGININESLGIFNVTPASGPFVTTSEDPVTIIGPTEDVDGNPLTWSYQITSSAGSYHTVQFIAEDGNGNNTSVTASFQSETQPNSAIVTEPFSVTQTSNSFVMVPPVWEMPPSNPLNLNTEEDFNGWVDTNQRNTGFNFKPEYGGYIHSGSSRNGGYHPSAAGTDGLGVVVGYVEVPVVANQQYTVETRTQWWDLSTASGWFLDGDPGSKVRVVDTSNSNNSVFITANDGPGGPINSNNWVVTSGTITPTGNIVRVEFLATAGEQYIESITLTPS